MSRTRPVTGAMICLLAALPWLPAAAAEPAGPAPANDPYETLNRALFGLNAQLYAAWTAAAPAVSFADLPGGLQQGVHNAFGNLRDPLNAATGLATGEFATAWNATARFAINSTLGALGTSDAAAALGYPADRLDLGTALCRARLLTDPPYLVMPLLGPTSIGDVGGQLATNLALRALLGTYYWPYYVPYYVLDRIDLYLQRAPSAAATDAYAAQQAGYLAQRARRCATPRGG